MRSRVIDARSITHRIQEKEQRITDAENTRDDINTKVKENAKGKKFINQYIQEIQDTMRNPILRIISIEKRKDSQHKGPVNFLNKIIEENTLPKLKRCS